MSIWVAIAVYAAVNTFGLYLLTASGVLKTLLQPATAIIQEGQSDPLVDAPRGWIENHSFWDLEYLDAENVAEHGAENEFWGQAVNDSAG